MKGWSSFLGLLGSVGTLVCCVIPTIFVVLGFGAAFAGVIGTFPQITWLSEHKGLVFGVAGVLIALAGYTQWRARSLACPTDPELAKACQSARGWSRWVFWISVGFYFLGGFVAFVLPKILA